MKLIHIVLCAFFLAACAGQSPETDPPDFALGVKSPTTITFNGVIYPASMDQLIEFIDAHPDATTLEVTSGGGDVISGAKAGRKISERKLNLLINDYCMSSCANYFVMAAASVHVTQGAVIGYHGNPSTFPFPLNLISSLSGATRSDVTFLEGASRPSSAFQSWNTTWDQQYEQAKTEGNPDVNWLYLERSLLEAVGITVSAESYFASNQRELNRHSFRLSQLRDGAYVHMRLPNDQN